MKFDLKQELPDLILADLSDPPRYVFCEIVASDGPMTETRKDAFLDIIGQSGIPETNAVFLTAFDDRQSPAFRKNFSKLASDSLIWFRTEPDLLLVMSTRSDIPLK